MGYLIASATPRTDWCLPDRSRAGPQRPQPDLPARQGAGRLLSINGMIYMRGQRATTTRWADAARRCGGAGTRCCPVFKRSEDHGAAVRDLARRTGGEWRVERQRACAGTSLDALGAGGAEAGIPARATSTGDNFGVGLLEVNQKSGWRWNATKAFLRPGCGAPNFRRCGPRSSPAVAQATATARCMLTGRANSRSGGAPKARGEVISSAGAIGSPQILQLSGIGDGGAAGRGRDAAATAARRRQQPAGPPADPRRLQGARHAHAEPSGRHLVGQGRHRAGTADAQRADEHVAVAAGRVHARSPRSHVPTSSTTCSR